MIGTLFHAILYRPFFNALIFLYQTIAFHDLGIAIVFLTVIIRFVLFPLFYKGLKNQTLLMKIQPHIQEIQKNHKKDKAKQAQALMDLYKAHNVNPFSGIFITLIQLPILIAVYAVFRSGLATLSPADIYPFIAAPAAFNAVSLGLLDLTKTNILVALLAAVVQGAQAILAQSRKVIGAQGKNPMASTGKFMIVVGPLMTVWILSYVPSAIGVYWLTTSIFSAVQQYYVNKVILKQHGTVDTGKPEKLRERAS